MQFRELLPKTYERFGQSEFDVTDVYLASSSPKKIVSNDLGRLYRMGFLKRRRMKRLCASLRGHPCNRGFQYKYSLSKRGLGYIGWLGEGKPAQDLAYAKLRSEALSSLSEEDRKTVLAGHLVEASVRYKGPGSNLKPAASDLLVNICVANQNRNLTADRQELAGRLLNEAIEAGRLSREKEIEHLKNIMLERLLEQLKSESNQFFNVSMKTLAEQIILDSLLYKFVCRIAELYRETLERTLAVLAVIFPTEAVDRLVSFIIESEKPLIDSIIHEFESSKILEKPAQMDSTTDRPNTTDVIEKRYEATSPKSNILMIETWSERRAETLRGIFGTNAGPKSGILENEMLDLNSKTNSELAKKLFGERNVNKT